MTRLFVAVTLATCALLAPAVLAQQQEIPDRQEVLAIMTKAADYQLAEQANKKFDNDWIRSAFYTGVMALYDASKDQKYRDAAVAWGEQAKWTPPRDQRHADRLCCGQTYCELYLLERAESGKGDEQKIAPFRAAVDRMMASPQPGRVDWWWCDALYMAPPAFVRLAAATGDDKYVRFMNELWWDATDFLYDPEEKLYYRDKKYFPPNTTANGKKIFWSRGNGWVAAGTVRVLQFLPQDFPERQKFVDLHKEMSAKIVTLQGEDGLWRPSLLDPEEFPTPETSGTAFFTYALAWGINNGTLDRERYLPHVLKGWHGLVSKVNDEGRLTHVQRVAAAPGAVNPEDTHEYAVGALLLAGSEVMKLQK